MKKEDTLSRLVEQLESARDEVRPIAPLTIGESDHLAAVKLQVALWLGVQSFADRRGLQFAQKLLASLSAETKAYWSAPGYIENLAERSREAFLAFSQVAFAHRREENLIELGARLSREVWVHRDAPNFELIRDGLRGFLVVSLAETLHREGKKEVDPAAAAEWFRSVNRLMHPSGVKGLRDRSFDLLGLAMSDVTSMIHTAGTASAKATAVGSDDAVTYHIPANYWPWKKLKVLLSSAHAVAVGDEQIGGSAQAAISLFHECGQNFYLVGKQFLDELEETKMSLDGLKIMEEAPLPYKAFLLLFPLGYLKVHVVDGTEQEVVALHVSVVDEGPETASGLWFGCVYEDGSVHRMFSTSIGFRKDGTLIDTAEELYTQHEDNTHIPPEVQEKLVQSTLHLGSLITKILAAMAAAPKIVETDVVESVRKAKKDRPRLTFKTPKVIGWKIRYIKRADRPKHSSSGGPVSPHWRCKHLRRVPYGPTSVPLEDRPRRVVEIPEVRVNSEYETNEL